MNIGNIRRNIRGRARGRLAGALVVALAGTITLAATATEARAQFRRGRSGSYDSRNDLRGLQASVETDRSRYGTRDTVEITVRLTNTSDRAVSVNLDDDYEYDVTIREGRSGVVWQRSRDDRGARRERRTLRLAPNQVLTNRVRWDQRDSDGRRVRGGTYRIEARVYGQSTATTEVRLTGDNDGRDDDYGNGGRPFPGGGIPRPFPAPGEEDDRWGGGWGRNNLRTELRADTSTVRPGDTITLRYTIRNNTSRTQTLRFPTSQQFDVVARSSRGRTIWRLSDGRGYTQAFASRTLRPGEEHTFTTSWRVDRDQEGGTYEILAFLTPQGARNGVGEARTTLRVSGRTGGYRRD